MADFSTSTGNLSGFVSAAATLVPSTSATTSAKVVTSTTSDLPKTTTLKKHTTTTAAAAAATTSTQPITQTISTPSASPTIAIAPAGSSDNPSGRENVLNILVTGVVPGAVGAMVLFLAFLVVLGYRRRRKLIKISSNPGAAAAATRSKPCTRYNPRGTPAPSQSSASMNSRRWLSLMTNTTPHMAEMASDEKPAEMEEDRTMRELEAGVRQPPVAYTNRRVTLQSIQELPA